MGVFAQNAWRRKPPEQARFGRFLPKTHVMICAFFLHAVVSRRYVSAAVAVRQAQSVGGQHFAFFCQNADLGFHIPVLLRVCAASQVFFPAFSSCPYLCTSPFAIRGGLPKHGVLYSCGVQRAVAAKPIRKVGHNTSFHGIPQIQRFQFQEISFCCTDRFCLIAF